MTVDEAIAACGSRWSRPTPDAQDLEERLAIRTQDLLGPVRLQLVILAPAARLFVHGGRAPFTSRHVPGPRDCDRAVDELLERTRTP